MRVLSKPTTYVLTHPLTFALRTLRSFSHNQGLLLAGAVAYYALLSVVPLLIVSVIALSYVVDQAELLGTLGRYLEWVVPSQSRVILADVTAFLKNGIAIGAVLLVTMLFFSSVAFTVLEKAMCIILAHRESIHILGWNWSLSGVSGVLLYLLGFSVESLILAALYLAMPITPIRVNHALVGGFFAALMWEILRHILIWYLATLSNASVVYGSLTTAVVVLFSMELAATVLLLGAQVIAEYERLREE